MWSQYIPVHMYNYTYPQLVNAYMFLHFYKGCSDSYFLQQKIHVKQAMNVPGYSKYVFRDDQPNSKQSA